MIEINDVWIDWWNGWSIVKWCMLRIALSHDQMKTDSVGFRSCCAWDVRDNVCVFFYVCVCDSLPVSVTNFPRERAFDSLDFEYVYEIDWSRLVIWCWSFFYFTWFNLFSFSHFSFWSQTELSHVLQSLSEKARVGTEHLQRWILKSFHFTATDKYAIVRLSELLLLVLILRSLIRVEFLLLFFFI